MNKEKSYCVCICVCFESLASMDVTLDKKNEGSIVSVAHQLAVASVFSLNYSVEIKHILWSNGNT